VVGLKVRFKPVFRHRVILPLLVGGVLCGAEISPYLYTEAPRLSNGKRFPGGARLMVVSGGAPRALVPGFAASADAAVSFDGKRVLFSGREKPESPWQIWEAGIDGGAPRRITNTAEDCIRPFYLPDDKLVYARRTPQGFQLEIAPLAGGTPLRLTYGAGDHVASDVLLDGRVLFDGPHSGARDIFTVYVDGSGVETVRCDHRRDRHSARQIASGDTIFQTGATVARFTSARAVQVPVPLPKGEYAGPVAEIAPGEWLLSYRAAASAPFALCRVKPGQAQAIPEKVVAAQNGNALDPVLVRPHALPKRHPSGLGDRNGANVLCLNAYTSRGVKIPDGVIAAVRVYAQDDAGAQVALGQAPVERDGSFFVQVPTERPIRFELLDKSAKVVGAEKGWFWMRRGEQRVCVGCHAGPERAPDNAVPAVLLRTTDPVKFNLPVHSGNGGMQ
jgi:hypothetical protein